MRRAECRSEQEPPCARQVLAVRKATINRMVLDRARSIRLVKHRVRKPIVGSPTAGLRGSLRDSLFVPHLGRLRVTVEPWTTDVLTTGVVIARGRVGLPRPFASDCADAGL